MKAETRKKGFSARLVAVREHLGLTQEAFAKRTGIPLSTLKKYEGSHREPGAKALKQMTKGMAKADINAYWLLSGEGPMLLTLSRLAHARDAAVLFVMKRSTISKSEGADLMQTAFDKKLDEEGLEREFGARYPKSRGRALDTGRLVLAIDTVEKGLAQAGSTPDQAGRAELIATVYDMLEDPTDRNQERILRLFKLAR